VRAAIFFPPAPELELAEVVPATLGPTDVRVAIEASGVCRTDLSVIQGLAGDAGPDQAQPLVLGHEAAGRVVDVGDAVRHCAIGDRVIASFVPACGACWHCVRDESNHCETFGTSVQSMQLVDGTPVAALAGLGTFADFMTVTHDALVPVRTDLPSDQLALIGCSVATGVGAALWTAEVRPGSTVAVFGCGGVGSFVIQGARIAGASRIIAVDPFSDRRDALQALGATDFVNPTDADPVEQIQALTDGRGVDYAFEVVGSSETIMQAYNATRARGTTVVVGMPPFDASITLPAFPLFLSEKRLIGSYYGSVSIRRGFPMLVELAESGRLDIGAAVSRRIALEDINDAFRAMESGAVLRSVIVNNGHGS
jgi:S-(hydroxymethyl)glutathione dehydrogenase/alcohol dehydrogenase